MVPPAWLARRRHYGLVLLTAALASFVASWKAPAQGEGGKIKLLRIGTTGTLESGRTVAEKKATLKTLKQFIKDETGFANEIVDEKGWRPLVEQMVAGKLQLGVFQGYEFAWAKQCYPALKPLALAVNSYTYPVVYVVTRKNDAAANFPGVQGQSLALLAHGQGALPQLFVDRQCQALGKTAKDFFSRLVVKTDVEDILDDVVNGTEQVAAVERSGLEAYKRRKPGRFNQLKEIAKSVPVLPPLIACYDNQLDQATLTRFRNGLVSANRKEKGQVLMTMFRLTAFETPPADFDRVRDETLKVFPPENTAK